MRSSYICSKSYAIQHFYSTFWLVKLHFWSSVKVWFLVWLAQDHQAPWKQGHIPAAPEQRSCHGSCALTLQLSLMRNHGQWELWRQCCGQKSLQSHLAASLPRRGKDILLLVGSCPRWAPSGASTLKLLPGVWTLHPLLHSEALSPNLESLLLHTGPTTSYTPALAPV